MYRWGPLLALTGCAQLAGIDDTSKAPDPTLSSLQVEHVSIGTTITRGPQDLTAVTAEFLVADATAPGGFRRVPAALSGDTWQADLGGVPAPVLYTSPEVPNAVVRMLDFPTPTLEAIVPVLEHPQPEPAPAGATLTVNVNLDTAHGAENYLLWSIGAWYQDIGLPAPVAGATAVAATVMLDPAQSPVGRLDRITPDDSVFLLRRTGNQVIAHLPVPAFDQTMTNTDITGTFVTTPLDQTLDLRVSQMEGAARLSTVRPGVGPPSYVWRVRASPGADFVIDNGPQLHAASVPAPMEPDPQTITAAYGNPFAASFPTMVSWQIAGNRTYTNPTTMLSTTLTARLLERAAPTPGLVLAHPAGLPDRITANGTVLNIDNATVTAAATEPIEVSFVVDRPANTLHQVQVLELVPDAMSYTLANVVVVMMPTPSTRIPRDLFKDGSLYVIRAFSMQGCFTAAATGDLSQLGLPCSIAFADSGVFQVVSP